MARNQLPPQPNTQTKIILDAVDELRQMIEAQGNALLEFSGRYDRRFPSHSVDTRMADMVRADRLLPLIYVVMQDEVFSCVSLKDSVIAVRHEQLAMEIDTFKNNKRLGNFFSRIVGDPIENGLAVKRVTPRGAVPQLWQLVLTKQV